MRDTELYRHLLGLEPPWFVSNVELDVKDQRVDVWTEHEDRILWPCPVCGKSLPLYDHTEVRVWRHLDSCQFMTYLHARPPRVKCPEHNVLQVRLPWAEERSRFTAMFERLAIDVLQESSVAGAMRILRISWDEAWGIMERAVRRGMAAKEDRTIEYLGVDEKSVARGHTYFTVVCDLELGTVEYVADDRRQASLDGYFQGLSEEQLEGIEGIAMDMWDPYVASVLKHVPEGREKIVFDRYHIMKQMNDAVDSVRKGEHRELLKAGDESLKRTKYLWLYAGENLPEKHRERFEALKAQDLRTGRAWAIKENLRELWNSSTREVAFNHWLNWYSWARRSRLKPIQDKARMLAAHIDNILTYFSHYITNALTEAVNSTIQKLKKMAYGYRNRENFKTAIYFHCGGLQLYPTHTIS